ncbi:unnamed protein product [Aphanomyces euteiches]|uniref:FYVE-type domain-containing protein n=1 Tax=Aphanomyces euteiches TaxID=100861 RepID=A0A6G0X5B9_9STRA|nr:hypothetical protein Ae201684_008267 [Aphanomyces euteiches]KAH9070640.1 hypothetical protein Ae201684P_002996 [Aphanomyces euteiches]KAH9154112.1 hypothetical protein AeRB84_003742 [Aphanomyces euteiches]
MSKFPLPANFFRCPPLKAEEKERILKSGESTSADMVMYSRVTGGPIKWNLSVDEASMKIYKGEDPSAPPGVVAYLGVTEVMATIDEVVNLFRTDTTEEYQEYCKMFMKDLLDGQILYTLRKRTPENPHHLAAIKWFAIASPIPGITKARDWCFLETQHDFELDGRKGWTRAFKSLNMACCPDLQHSLGLVRGIHYRTGFCFLESDRPGYLEAHQLAQIDIRGKMVDMVIDLGMRRRLKIMKELDTFLRQKRLALGTFVELSALVPKESRSKCFVCQRKFGAFSKKWNCRKCCEVVCRRCSQTWEVSIAGAIVERRVCTACSTGHIDVPQDTKTIVDEDEESSTRHVDSQTHSNYSNSPRSKQLDKATINLITPSQLSHLKSSTSSTTQFRPPQPNDMYMHEQQFPNTPQKVAMAQLDMSRMRIDDVPVMDEEYGGYKDDMSNYSESMASFQQPFHRPMPVHGAPQGYFPDVSPEYTGHRPGPYDPRRMPPPRAGYRYPQDGYGGYPDQMWQQPPPRYPLPPQNRYPQPYPPQHNPYTQTYHYPRDGPRQAPYPPLDPYAQLRQPPPNNYDYQYPQPPPPQPQSYTPQSHNFDHESDNTSAYGGSQTSGSHLQGYGRTGSATSSVHAQEIRGQSRSVSERNDLIAPGSLVAPSLVLQATSQKTM